ATDLTSKGELIVNLDNGQQKILSSGEISLKKWT
ncbi:biotin--[acetyl-CoA-carboxylase] ligase, partial [Lactococcus lactis]|nr:biotin--[acetyl-CoA-carboxylase] ligase [Lactococcus lactis]